MATPEEEVKRSLLSRVGTGLLAFGANRTSSSILKERTGAKIAANQATLGQQEIAANQAETLKQQRQQELSNTAFGDGPESDRAMTQLAIEFPEQFEASNEAVGLVTQAQKNEAADFAFKVRNTPFDQRQPLINARITDLVAQGRDPQHTASLNGQSEADQNPALLSIEIGALTNEQRLERRDKIARGGDIPAEQQAFEALIANFTPEEQKMARRVKAGLATRAGTIASVERIAIDPTLTTQVAESQAEIREAGKFAELTGSSRAKAIDAGFKSIEKIDANIRNLDRAVAALDAGAQTGPIITRFTPTIRESSVELQQIQSSLGLDVVQSVSFGALSEGELNLAMSTALPTNLEPPALRQWIVDRQAAQRKLRGYLSDQINFLDEGGTIAGFLRSQTRKSRNTVDGFTVEEVP